MAINPWAGTTCGYLGMLIAFSGQYERGVEIVRRMMALNPFSCSSVDCRNRFATVIDIVEIFCSLFEIALCEPNQRDLHIRAGED